MCIPVLGTFGKTDKLDADGLGLLLHNGTLPSVWIPPGELRDEREVPRPRMAPSLDRESYFFPPKWRPQFLALLERLPPETRRCMVQELELLELVQGQIDRLEARILERVRITRSMQLIQ